MYSLNQSAVGCSMTFTGGENPVALVTYCITHLLLCDKPPQNQVAQNIYYCSQLLGWLGMPLLHLACS